MANTNLECRMYEAEYPRWMAVMVQVHHITETGAYVLLLEYNNMEGMISFSELSRCRIRSVSSLIKVGHQEPASVLRVNKEKGYIDLSKKTVSEEDVQACEKRYNKSKLVHSIMHHVAEIHSIDLSTASTAMPMSDGPDSILDFLTKEVKEAGPDGEVVKKVVQAVTEEVTDTLVKNIRCRMRPQSVKIRADIEIRCYQFDGVLDI